jgi:endonuclease/exonuclease/phosphatase family metal-dependent hydrolase
MLVIFQTTNLRKVIALTVLTLISFSLVLIGFSSSSSSSQSLTSVPRRNDDKLTLMTQNLYQGADLGSLASATTPTEFLIAVAAAYNRTQATDFPERAESIADEIEQASPVLIGLQEAVLIRTQVPADGPATPATTVAYDYIQILLDKLDERGLHYRTAIVQKGSDIEVPGLFSTGRMDVRLTDRDAILVKEDLRDFTLSNAQSGQYAAKSTLPTPLGTVSVPMSWVSVDLTFNDGNKGRIVSTRLEPVSPSVQMSQANELLGGPGNTRLPLALIGDFNSNADGTGTQTYANLVAAGFRDAWATVGMSRGFTCCQDADLLNSESELKRRIDLVLFNGNFKIQDIQVIGDSAEDRTPSGLWPSDHAGLVAKLKLTVLKN